MRLTNTQKETFKHLAAEIFGENVRLYLFGSRIDDRRAGGDIDLYVVGFDGTIEQQFDAKLQFLVEAKLILGEQRIDLVFAPVRGQKMAPIQQLAERTGIPL